MRHLLIFLAVLGWMHLAAQSIEDITTRQLKAKIDQHQNGLFIINFWATWCGPCVKELPYFEALSDNNQVKVLLVSLDFPDEKTKVEKFVTKKSLKSPVVILNEKDIDGFMRSIADNWSGAIPATLFITTKGKRYFYEGAFEQRELNELVTKYLTNP